MALIPTRVGNFLQYYGGCSLENFVTMIETVHKYGRYGSLGKEKEYEHG